VAFRACEARSFLPFRVSVPLERPIAPSPAPPHQTGRDHSSVLSPAGKGCGRPRRTTPSERRAPRAVSRIQAIAELSETSPILTPVAWRESGLCAASGAPSRLALAAESWCRNRVFASDLRLTETSQNSRRASG
jgi:hypothetical protein